jgi:predicted small lipoprotein YifL
MNRLTSKRVLLLVSTALLGGALAACGLKGPLELPDRPTNMVIRPAPGAAPATTPETPAGEAPAPPAPETVEPEEEERPAPPDLPRGQRGGASS